MINKRFYDVLWANKQWIYDTKYEVLVFRYDHNIIEQVTIKMYKEFKAQLNRDKNLHI